MERDQSGLHGDSASDTRRQMLAKLGVGAAVVWAAPMVTSIKASAQAVGSAGEPTTTTTTTSPATTTTTEPPGEQCAPVDLSFPAGWTSVQTGRFNAGEGALGFEPFVHTVELNGPPQHVVELDAATATASKTISKSVDLVGGKTYTFAFQSRGYSNNPATQTVTASIGTSSLTVVSDSYGGQVWTDDHSFTFAPATTGSYTFSFSHVVNYGTGDDVGVTAPVVTCT